MSVSHADTVLPDATLEEMQFWERIYAAVVSAPDCKDTRVAASWATGAVLKRRIVFPNLAKETLAPGG